MDYSRIYGQFIASRKAIEPTLSCYTEKHHILPRCMGGDNSVDNLVRLTAGDHFFAHLLLAKIHGGKMWYALNALVEGEKIGDRGQDRAFMRRARRWYEQTKQSFAAEHSRRMKGAYTGSDHPMFGRPCPPVALDKLNARIAAGWNPMNSEESRNKCRQAMLGREITPEWRAKISATKTGQKMSAEARAAISAGHKGKKIDRQTVEKIAAANRGKKRTPEQVAAMRKRLTGRKLSPEHVAKLLPHLAGTSRFKGKSHSPETRARMSAVCQARREYVARFGGITRTVTIETMRAAGIDI